MWAGGTEDSGTDSRVQKVRLTTTEREFLLISFIHLRLCGKHPF